MAATVSRVKKQLYVIQARMGEPVKIGIASDVSRRLQELQTANARKLHVLGIGVDGSVEREIHRQLSHLRTHGEWFRWTAETKQVLDEHVQWQRHVCANPQCFDCISIELNSVEW